MRFEQPETLETALEILKNRPEITVLAGGTDVVLHKRTGKLQPVGLLDITRIPQLKEIRLDSNRLVIGAAATFSEIECNAFVQVACPLLCLAAMSVGSPQIRSCGTLGGNVANASPAADTIPALTAADAIVLINGSNGLARRVSIEELVIGASRNTLAPGELITAFEVPLFQQDSCWSFEKIGRRNALAISRLNGACTFKMKNGRMTEVHLCIGSTTSRPHRFHTAEQSLEGGAASDEQFYQAGVLVAQEILAQTGLRESSAYKLPVAADLTVRLLKTARERKKHDHLIYPE